MKAREQSSHSFAHLKLLVISLSSFLLVASFWRASHFMHASNIAHRPILEKHQMVTGKTKDGRQSAVVYITRTRGTDGKIDAEHMVILTGYVKVS